MYPKGKFGSKPNIEFTDCENLDDWEGAICEKYKLQIKIQPDELLQNSRGYNQKFINHSSRM